MTDHGKARQPEDLTRLFVERANSKDEAGARAQVVRRQPDGSWLRLLDQPGFTPVTQ
jgi:hypothetical protein